MDIYLDRFNLIFMINFQEHTQTGYAMRTWDNARLSDLTIAFAIDFNTPGELLTRKAAYGKYQAVDIISGFSIYERLDPLARFMRMNKITKLNIAGSGIYGLKEIFTQEELDTFIGVFLQTLIFEYYGEPVSIRSGGQTGVDEAALKAGDKLGLETICLAPKHWMFRNIEGKDICSQSLFLKRFGAQYDITDIL